MTRRSGRNLQALWNRIDELHPMIGLSVPNELYGARKDLAGLEKFVDAALTTWAPDYGIVRAVPGPLPGRKDRDIGDT